MTSILACSLIKGINSTRGRDVFKTMAPGASMECGLSNDIAAYPASQRAEDRAGSGKAEITEEEKERIINEFLPFIKYTAYRLSWGLPPQLTPEDLISVGVMGLLDALRRYTEGRVKLGTFVQFRIRGAMLDELRAHNWIPKSMNRKINAARTAHLDLEKKLGRLPEEKEVAAFLGITLDEYFKTLRVATMQVSSFDDINERLRGEDHLDITECLSDPDAKSPFEILEDNEKKELLASLIDRLPEKEKLILSLYYWEEMTMKEIAAAMKLTEGRICQLHNQALTRLKAKLNSEPAASVKVSGDQNLS
jgi:RNA polymerase sigma factor for flagellar operon FliA